ncbi:MAG: hypothetical protein ACRDRJ_01995 [Streptosporangiaceae bacterium]
MFSTTTRSGTGRNGRNSPYVLDELFVSFHRSAAGTAWRWRAELATLTLITAALWRLTSLITLTWGALVLAAFVVIVLAVPHSRRFITRRAWCVLIRHRFQRLCWEARLHTRTGRLPLVLRCQPTRVGARLRVICRAGICADDFTTRAAQLAAACYAREVRVTRNRRWSQIVTIDIIRHDTLAASHTVASPLQRLTAHYHLDQARAEADPAITP